MDRTTSRLPAGEDDANRTARLRLAFDLDLDALDAQRLGEIIASIRALIVAVDPSQADRLMKKLNRQLDQYL